MILSHHLGQTHDASPSLNLATSELVIFLEVVFLEFDFVSAANMGWTTGTGGQEYQYSAMPEVPTPAGSVPLGSGVTERTGGCGCYHGPRNSLP